MVNETAQVLESALHLPAPDRAFLAEQLLASLDSDEDFPLSEEWRKEILRRCEEIDRGEVELIPADAAFRSASA
jgi:putative addiction module component (TIGR02574 family)